MNQIILGWREWLTLPELGIDRIKAKVDTGARTSALHTFELKTFTEGGITKVRFHIHPFQNDLKTIKICTATLIDERNVTDSGGHIELRPVIQTSLCLGGITKAINITLTNRENMKFRMLLGRTAMTEHFMVDPDQSYLCGTPQTVTTPQKDSL